MSSFPKSDNTFQVGGSLPPNAPTYVRRQADKDLYTALKAGEFCYVLNARQMGKSSLRVQTMRRLQAEGIVCGVIDISAIGSHDITPQEWHLGVLRRLTRSLGTRTKARDWWQTSQGLSPVQRLGEFIDEVLLTEIAQPIVVFVDEIDSILPLSFKDDFFALIRACYNQRAENRNYQRLTFALLGVTTPSDLIQDKTRTPFNIGRAIDLQGFQLHEAQPLLIGLADNVPDPATTLQAILHWTGGQPFLTQKVCRLMLEEENRRQNSGDKIQKREQANESDIVSDVIRARILHNWEAQDQPEHLKTIQLRILQDERRAGRLLGLYQQVLSTVSSSAGDGSKVFADGSTNQVELRLSGLVVERQGQLQIANRIYAAVFNQVWAEQQLASLRPYAEAITTWLASGYTDESRLLRGQALEDARTWSAGKQLSNDDHLFLDASQELNQRELRVSFRQVKATNQQLIEAGKKAKRLIQIGVGILASTIAVAAIIGSIAAQRLQQATLKLKSAELEQTSLDALQQFEFEEINALVTAMKAGQDLKALITQRSTSEDYLAHGTVVSTLQQILNKIRAKHIFQANGLTISTAYSPDGQLIATSGESHKATLWDLQGNVVTELLGHDDSIWDIKFSPNGNLVATASSDGTAKLWDLQGNEVQIFADHNSVVTELAFSPDGESLVTATAIGTAKIWNLKGELRQTLVGHKKAIWGIGISPDGKSIATSSDDGTVVVWDFDGNKKVQFRVDMDEIRDVEFSPDGQLIATASNSIEADSVGKLWDLDGNQLAEIKGHSGGVFPINFSLDGKIIATGSSDKTARLWDLEGNQLAILTGHESIVYDVKFNPSGKELITVSWKDGTVRIWSLFPPKQNLLKGHKSALLDVDISPDGQLIATASDDKTVRFWNPQGQLIDEFEAPYAIRSIDFSPDGQIIAAGLSNGTVYLWSTEGRLIQEFLISSEIIEDVNFSPDGQMLAVLGLGESPQIRNLEGEILQTLKGHQASVHQIAFSPTASVVATASQDGTVKLWNFQGEVLKTLQLPDDIVQFQALDFSPDGQTITAGSIKGDVFMWSADGEFQSSYQAHVGPIIELRFSPDGRRIMTASEDGKARLWDIKGRKLGEFSGHKGWIRSVAFSSDGEFFVTASDDRTARIWKVESLDQLLTRGCNWLHDYLVKTPSDLLELKVCQTDARLAAAAPTMLDQAQQTAREGNLEQVVTQLQTALQWNPDLDLDPKTEVPDHNPKIVAQKLVKVAAAQKLAAQGNITDAIATFQQAQKLDPSVDLNSDTAELENDPEILAKQIAASATVAKGQQLVEQGDIEAAIAAYHQAQELDPNIEISAQNWNSLCWDGSLHGHAADVMFACKKAVALEPENGDIIDSRGLARALTDDFEGAIEDFQIFIEWTTNGDKQQQRQDWIKSFQSGENPFTEDVLESLR